MVDETWPDHAADYDHNAAGDAPEQRWQKAFDEALTVGSLRLDPTEIPELRRLRGRCPRCGHELQSIDVFSKVVVGILPVERQVATTNITCNCEHEHAHRPGGKDGCGWAPNLSVTLSWPSE